MMNQAGYKNWQLTLDADHILWLLLNKENASANTLDEAIFSEFEAILTNLSSQIKGIVIGSAKASGFIAGADIEQFTRLTTIDETLALIHRGQQICAKLEELAIPTVAMIHGFCLGGGLELALACRYRVAEDAAKTKLGLPEVLLGIHPGWGGSIRLPRLIGAIHGMDLILTGRTINARTAKKIGLIDACVAKRQLYRAARDLVLMQPKPYRASLLQAITNHRTVRPILAAFLKKKLKQKIPREHYPAPYAVLDNWLFYGVSDKAYAHEAISLSRLQQSDTAKNLIRLFFLQEQLKAQAKGIAFAPRHIHVIGAGTMGGDIAAWCALRGMRVTLQDREPKYIAPAIKRAYALYKKKLKLPQLIQQTMDRLLPDIDGNGIKQADIIIEAIYENLEAKQALFKQLEAIAKPEAILATNTSSIPLDQINAVLVNPERLVGIHFFNPVAKMQLVEIVKAKNTRLDIIQKATAFVRGIERLPVQVASSPGFLVNRALMPYLMEAMQLLDEGVPGPWIDEAALAFGMPMGPIELADTVGLDVCLSVAKNLTQHFGGAVSPKLIAMVEQGKLGRKNNEGFYTYKKGKPIKSASIEHILDKKTISDRLMLRMINEAVACLREGVITDQDLLDAGMVFGTGFAPFRGGPMHYVKSEGKAALLTRLQHLQQQFGDRFKPDAGWADI